MRINQRPFWNIWLESIELINGADYGTIMSR